MPTLEIESRYKGKVIAGVDEVGRGALVGPVVAASVIINQEKLIPDIDDSKKLSPKKREYLYEQIVNSYPWAIGMVSCEEIDKINILEATKKACLMAIENLNYKPEVVLVDGNMKFGDSRFVSIIKGDTISTSIAAGSIVAKVTRDRILCELSKDYPEYSWHKNVGYGTAEHIKAINSYGLSPYHRKSFKIYIKGSGD